MLTHKQRAGKRKARLKQEQEKNNSIAAGWRLVLGTINDGIIIAAAALHDEFGFGDVRVERFLKRYSEIFEACIQDDMLDIKEVEQTLKVEGIKCIEWHKYDFLKVEKE